MRWLVAVGVLAGCGPRSAIEVVVEVDPAMVDELRLYVGLGGNLNNEDEVEDMLVPRGYHAPMKVPHGFYWKREAPVDSDFITIAGQTSVSFVFQPGTHDEITVVAVGSKLDKPVAAAVVDAVMEDGVVRRYPLPLVPARSPLEPGAELVTIHEWGAAAPERRDCVHYESGERSTFIVAKNDRDCDGIIDDDPMKPECNPDMHLGYKRPGREDVTCVRQEVIGEVTPFVLGGASCTEAPIAPPHAKCSVPGTVCIENDVGSTCENIAGNPLECIAAAGVTSPAATHIGCTFFIGPAGICQPTAVLADRFPRVDPAICDTSQEFLFFTPGNPTWTRSGFTKSGTTFTATKPNGACDFRLTVGQDALNQASIAAVVSAPLANKRGIAFPLAVHFDQTPSCTEPNAITECKFVDGAPAGISTAFRTCVTTPIMPPW